MKLICLIIILIGITAIYSKVEVSPPYSQPYFTFRKYCNGFVCSGYVFTPVNPPQPVYEYYINLIDFNLDDPYELQLNRFNASQIVNAPDNTVIVQGNYAPYTDYGSSQIKYKFIVNKAFRWMPVYGGSQPGLISYYYFIRNSGIQCPYPPCNRMTADLVNYAQSTPLNFYTEPYTSQVPNFDSPWYNLNAVSFNGKDRMIHYMNNLAQIVATFTRIPEPNCPPQRLYHCPINQYLVYKRINRCLIVVGCSPLGACSAVPPQCPPGYVVTSYPGPGACPVYNCDPSFLGNATLTIQY
eukprot:gene10396-12767_t